MSDLGKRPRLWFLVRPSPATDDYSVAAVFVITRETYAVAAARKIPKRAVLTKSGAKHEGKLRPLEGPLSPSERDIRDASQMPQNEELRRTQIELKATCDRYAALYDFSPAGHLTLDSHGTIVEIGRASCRERVSPRV